MTEELTEDERSRRRIALMKQKMAGEHGFADAARNAGMFSRPGAENDLCGVSDGNARQRDGAHCRAV